MRAAVSVKKRPRKSYDGFVAVEAWVLEQRESRALQGLLAIRTNAQFRLAPPTPSPGAIASRSLIGRGVYRYRVVSTKVVGPDDVAVLDPSGNETLTLVTCYPFYFVGSAPDRLVVRAERII
jgi:LPXTG-site transpeptidase (sortase) family protein